MADQPDPDAPEVITAPDGPTPELDDAAPDAPTPELETPAPEAISRPVPESAAAARRRLDGHPEPPPGDDGDEPDEDDELDGDRGRDTEGPDLPGWLCRGCMGTGVRQGKPCPLCKGTGGIRPEGWDEEADEPKKMPEGAPSWWCKQCAGTGKLRNGLQCPSCLGTGGVPTA